MIIEIWIIVTKDSKMTWLKTLSVHIYHSLNRAFVLLVTSKFLGFALADHLLLREAVFGGTVHRFVDAHDAW